MGGNGYQDVRGPVLQVTVQVHVVHALATEMVLRGCRGMYSSSQENLIAQAPQRKIMPFKPLAPHGLSNNLQIQILMNVGFILFLIAVSSMECFSHLSLL